jgi:hypothetical protein
VVLGAGLCGLGARDGGLGADQGRIGALAGGGGPLHRAASDCAGVCHVRLLAGREVQHGPGLVEGRLLMVTPFLGVIQGLLVDVSGHLLAIDSSLTIVQDRRQPPARPWSIPALAVVAELCLVNSRLVSITGELLSVTERLLELAQALFSGQLLRAFRLIGPIGHARLPAGHR